LHTLETLPFAAQALRTAFSALMTAAAPKVTAAIDAIIARLTPRAGAKSAAGTLDPHEALMLRLNSQYPGGDVGVLASLFLNRVSLNAGQAVRFEPPRSLYVTPYK